jgi:pimeloyl-ACP methyl ester carboxylesterase
MEVGGGRVTREPLLPELHPVDVQGGELHVARWPGAAPVILAVHGGTSSHRVWSTIVRELRGAATVVAPDFRGAAGSAEVGPPYGMGAHVDDVRRVLDRFGIERCVLAGWSLGGFIAANAAAELAERAAALVLIDGGLPLALPPGLDPRRVEAELVEPAMERYRMRFASRDAHRAYWRAHPALAPTGLWGPAVQWHFDDEVEEDADGLRWRVSLASLRADVADTLAAPTRDAVFRVRCPIRFVWAERGLRDEPTGYYPLDVVTGAAERLGMPVARGHGLNHYTLLLSDPGARLVAGELRAALHAARAGRPARR